MDDTLKELKPPSLLSKVALMESLDSTGGLMLAEKLSKLNDIVTKEGSQKKNEYSSDFLTPAENTTDINLGTGQTTAEFTEALKEHLKEVGKLQAQSLEGTKIDRKVEVIDDLVTSQPIPSGMIVLDKNDASTTVVSGFDLQPIVSNFAEEPKIAASSSVIMQGTSSNLNRSVFIGSQSFLGHLQHFERPTLHPNKMVVNEPKDGNDDEMGGFALQPIKTIMSESESVSPPTESLKSIKSIAEERKQKMLQKSKTLQKDMNGISVVNKRKDTPKASKSREDSNSKTSIPSLRKAPPKSLKTAVGKKSDIITSAKPPIKEQTSQKWKGKKTSSTQAKKSPTKRLNSDADDLIASVESFASYLKEYSKGEKDNVYEVAKSFTIDQDSRLSSLDRERSLQRELQHLRTVCEDERKRNEKLHHELVSREKEWERREEKLCFEYDKKLKDLQEESFILKKKLEFHEDEKKNIADIKGKALEEISKEDLEKLQRQVEQQEVLLCGYQQENEKLYGELKKHDIEKKRLEGKLFKDNQKLAVEVGNLKEQLETRTNVDSLQGSASLGANRITQLNNQVKFYQKRETEYKEEILRFENEAASLKKLLSLNEKQRNAKPVEQDLLKQIETLQSSHHLEIEKLQKRLKWYAENQELLDRDMSELKDKRDELKELRVLVDRLEEQNKSLRKEKAEKTSEENSYTKRILDLQRQVKEMDDIIRRRHPNSIPAIIYAASAVPGANKVYESSDSDKSRPINIYLEKRVKTLENELELKDGDSSKKVRAIEQRYSAMSMRYEEHIKQLETKIAELTLKLKSEKSVEALEVELAETKNDYTGLVQDLKKELKEKQGELSKLKLQLSERTNAKNDKRPKSDPPLQRELTRLKERLKNKEAEISDLTTTVSLLQKDRENLLTRKLNEERDSIQFVERNIPARYLTDRTTSPMFVDTDLTEKYSLLEKENKRLKNTVEELHLDCEEKRLKYEALEVKTLNKNRTLRENYEEHSKKTKEKHERYLEKLKMDFVLEHSNSKVAELNGKVQSYELMIDHLKGSLEEARIDREKLAACKVTEESLRREIRQLQDELHEARKHYTPEMHHYKLLETKILSMETRHSAKEQELQTIIEKIKYKASSDIDVIEDKWRDILRNKDMELQTFREELDSIIEVLEELQRQGIILPNYKINLPM